MSFLFFPSLEEGLVNSAFLNSLAGLRWPLCGEEREGKRKGGAKKRKEMDGRERKETPHRNKFLISRTLYINECSSLQMEYYRSCLNGYAVECKHP